VRCGCQALDCCQHPCAGVTGEPQPDLEIHQPALFATFQRLYQEHAPLAFRLASPEAGNQRVTVTVQDSDDKEVGGRRVRLYGSSRAAMTRSNVTDMGS